MGCQMRLAIIALVVAGCSPEGAEPVRDDDAVNNELRALVRQATKEQREHALEVFLARNDLSTTLSQMPSVQNTFADETEAVADKYADWHRFWLNWDSNHPDVDCSSLLEGLSKAESQMRDLANRHRR